MAPSDTPPPLMEKVITTWSLRCRLRLQAPPPREAWRLVALQGSGSGQRVILRLSQSGQLPVIVKARPGLNAFRFRESVKAQKAFATALAGHPTARAPAVFQTLRGLRAIAMEDATGIEALSAAQRNPARLPGVLKRSASWMDACWQAFPEETCRWNSRPARKRLDWALNKADHLRGDPAFEQLTAWCTTRIDELDGETVRMAPSHGDLHLRNIILLPQNKTYGIDFETWAQRPRSYDMARLIAHAATNFGPQNAVDMDQVERAYRQHALSGLSAQHPVDERFLDLFLAIDALVYRRDSAHAEAASKTHSRLRFVRARTLVDTLVQRSQAQ